MSMAGDYVDYMLERDTRSLDRLASFGIRMDACGKPAHAAPHARRKRGVPGTRDQRFERFFRTDGKRPNGASARRASSKRSSGLESTKCRTRRGTRASGKTTTRTTGGNGPTCRKSFDGASGSASEAFGDPW